MLIQHHQDEGLCETLQFQKRFLDSQQINEDNKEQKHLQIKRNISGPGPIDSSGPQLPSGPDVEMRQVDDDIEMADDPIADIAFEKELNSWLEGSNANGIIDDNIDSNVAEMDIANIVEYLGPSKDTNINTKNDSVPISGPIPISDPVPISNPVPISDPVPIPDPVADPSVASARAGHFEKFAITL